MSTSSLPSFIKIHQAVLEKLKMSEDNNARRAATIIAAEVKVFQKYVKHQGQGHEVKNYGTVWKVLSQVIHMCNMKDLPLLVRKLLPRLKFYKSRSNFKVKVTRSKIMVPSESSCHKEYRYEILKLYL